MNKIISRVKELFPLIMLAMTLVLIFVPLPIMVIQALIILNIGFSLFLFFQKFLNSMTIAYYFPKLVLYFSLFTCGLAIATTRTFLSLSNLIEHIPVIVFIGNWICRENYVCGFFTTLLLCISLIIYCRGYVYKSQSAVARFFLDGVTAKKLNIKHQVEQMKITEEEGKEQEAKVNQELEHYSSMDGSAKFLLGTMVVFAVLFIVAVTGGTAVGILDQGLPWHDALNQYIMLSSGYLVLFVVPLFLASLGFKVKVDK